MRVNHLAVALTGLALGGAMAMDSQFFDTAQMNSAGVMRATQCQGRKNGKRRRSRFEVRGR